MAKLLTYHTLPPVTEDFLGIAKDSQENRIICTYGRNLIIILDLLTSKQIKSWSTDEKLLKKVLFDTQVQQYVGIFGDRIIKCWTEDTSNISKVKRIKLPRTVHELIESDDGRVLVLYNNSFCESLQLAIENARSKQTLENTAFEHPETTLREIIQPKIVKTKSGELIFTFFTKNDQQTEIQFCYVEIDPDKLQPFRNYSKIRVKCLMDNQEMSAFTLIEGNEGLELVTLWSGNGIFIRKIENKPTHDTNNEVGEFSTTLSIIDSTLPVSMIGIQNEYLVIYASSSAKDGASLMLYNTVYKVVQSKHSFKVFFPESKLFVVQNNIFLIAGKLLSMIPFRLSKNKLSELLGSQRGPEIFNNLVDREDIGFDGFESNTYFDNSTKAINRNYDNTKFFMPKMQSKMEKRNQFAERTFEDYEAIEEKVSLIQHSELVVDVNRSENVPSGKVGIKTSKNIHDIQEMHLQFEMLAGKLERCGASEHEITERLIPLLIEAEQTTDLIAVLRRYLHISERMLVRVLKYALSCPAPDESELKDCNAVDLLNLVLSCSYDVNSIRAFLRNGLSLDDVFVLLKHLQKLYLSPNITLEQRPDKELYFDEDKIIIDWVCVLVDSHYQQICLSNDSEILELFKEWKKIVEDSSKAMQELSNLAPLIREFAEGKQIKHKKSTCKFYSIEKLQLY